MKELLFFGLPLKKKKISSNKLTFIIFSILFVALLYFFLGGYWQRYWDSDKDGVRDYYDAFPFNTLEQYDSDGDGYGDNSDEFPQDKEEWKDSDKDGYGDNKDAFPHNPSEWFDSDGDGTGDNSDEFPDNPAEWKDTDKDGYGDNKDAFPQDKTEWKDTDKDGVGDKKDAFPNDSAEQVDSDKDGYGDNKDAFPKDSEEWKDSDKDGYGDNGDDFPFDSSRHSKDSDNDGLTDEEEERLGTNPNDKDTDNDGILDGYDTHPNGGGRYLVRVLNWDYAAKSFSATIQIHSDMFDYYNNLERIEHGESYVTFKDDTIKELASSILSSGFNPVEMAVSMVQQLPYIPDEYTAFDEYPKYPVETLYDENGDCEDSSYLAASLIEAMGYDAVLVTYPGHMAIAVWCGNCNGYYYDVGGRKYYYYETTNSMRIGIVPNEYKDVTANLIQINGQNGKEMTI